MRKSGIRLTIGVLLLLLGSLQAQDDWEYPEDRMEYDSLISLARELPEDSLGRRSWLLHQAGRTAYSFGAYRSAIRATGEALDIRLSHEDDFADEVLVSAFNLGTYYSEVGEYGEALDHLSVILNRAPNRKEGVAHYQCGIVYGRTGEFEASERAFARAASLPPFAGNDYQRAYLDQQLGLMHVNKSNASGGEAAREPLARALASFRADEYTYGEMETLNLLGWAQSDAGQQEVAIGHLLKAEALAHEMEIEDEDLTAIYGNLGMAYRRSGQPEAALRQYHKALRLARSFSDADQRPNMDVAGTLDNLSTAHLFSGQLDSALYYAQRALEIATPDFKFSGTEVLPGLDQMMTDRPRLLTILLDLAKVHHLMGDTGQPAHYKQALSTYRRTDELLDAMRRDQLLDETRNYWRADARSLYDQALNVAMKTDDPNSAFYFMEKARSRLLLDELSTTMASEQLPIDVNLRLAEVARMTRLSGNTPAATQRFRQLQDSIFSAFPAYRDASIGAPPPDPATIGQLLNGRTLVEYYVGEDMTIALTYSPDGGLGLTELAPLSVWGKSLRALRDDLQRPGQPFGKENARQLYEQLIAPLDLAEGTPLTIVPDGDLYLLPFGALLSTEPSSNAAYQNWPWLDDEREINYAFSVQLLDLARQRRGRGNGRALALAPVARLRADGQLPAELELPATLRTVRHLATLFPADTLVNAAANRRAFREKADAYSLLHLGTHAYLADGGSFLLHDPEPARYSMANLLDHQLRADLVVIGACETGIGKALPGEGVASLGRGFARRGAPGLVMSLWSIDDATTAELLNSTYDGLSEQMGPATALHLAGVNYRQAVTNPGFGHPYYWAGLVNYGSNAPLKMGNESINWLAWIFCLIALILAPFLLMRRKR
ncbi:CHAT domain-containing protein [Neolewinella agarilytica]|uniref:CHAT domain-containing protein n=1 Tax=Neolewinella agarilytica TaxID=478744 RepID=A0A1H9F5E4_9BACT|nr:CHAT domain-containing tetratricopeptide repeat protein [Neolewinella agarilytica]SEQ33097.1 CHAT domain-containing protein [Neolewinella agarilytica]